MACAPADAGAADPSARPIVYTLRFPAPHTHYVEVEGGRIPARGAHLDLMMAVWTPGSYLVREYSRHVEGVTARGPRAAGACRSSKTRRTTGGSRPAARKTVTLTYRVYGREMSVRTNWIESGFAHAQRRGHLPHD